MSKVFSAERFLLNVATWAEETTNPDAGLGTPAAQGSWWQRQGNYPSVPTELYLKGQPQDTGWLKQNTINLNVFNVKDPKFGAVGDGVTDDTAAFQAAVDAANAAGGGYVYIPPVNVAGGKFYRFKRTATPFSSVAMPDYHNITIVGDGFASKVEMFDDSGGVAWNGFQVQGSASNIRFENFQLSGEGITNGPVASTNNLINVNGNVLDVGSGLNNVSVVGMFWGDINGGALAQIRFAVNGNDAVHQVVNTSMRYCLSASACTAVFFAGGATGFVNAAACRYSLVAGATSQGIGYQVDATNVGDIFECVGVIADGTATANGLLATARRGVTAWNVLAVGTGINGSQGVAGAQARNSLIRGNVVTTTTSATAGRPINCALSGVNFAVVGNVCAMLGDFNQQAIVSTTAPGLLAADNVCSTQSASAGPTLISLGTADGLAAVGNLAIFFNQPAGAGQGVNVNGGTTTDLLDAMAIGNLILAVGANRMAAGVIAQVQGTFDMHNINLSMNLISNATNSINLARGTGAFLDWRAVNDNNCPAANTAVVTVLASAGITQEGPAGPGAQIDVLSLAAGPSGVVAAPQGSLCANVVGGQATSLFYKESGAGVSGGTAGWFGIGGYDLATGALSLSTTLTALFLAPGGDGLLLASATEIQFAATRAGIIRNLRSKAAVAGTGGGTVTHTVRKNGVDTALTVAVVNTSTVQTNDVTHTFTVVAGDLLSVKITKTATITTAQTHVVDTIELV